MAFPHSTIPSLLTLNGFLEDRRDTYITVLGLYPSGGGIGSSRVCKGPFLPLRLPGRRRKVVCSGRLKVMEAQLVENGQVRGGVEIPVTCYQIVGVPDKAEKDEIVKAVLELKSTEIEEGYTLDVVVARQELLMDVRDKLLFEPEYAGNAREKIPPKSLLRIRWGWLPGALCLLQEVGEEKLVLEIGRAALGRPDAKPYVHDLLLSMALAECSIAKNSFEKNKVAQGFEALARAQYLLRSKASLGKMPLLGQIEESLEELAPACTLELLGMPHTPENSERRRGAIAALRELLRQGLEVETSCRVQDWPCFLSQALNKLMATEIVDLLPWDDLAITRKNKKSLESQNQRVIIDFNCFYMAMIAHIALGFSSRQTDLINKAKTICESLVAAEGIDLKFEEAFCSFLLGQGGESVAVERLRQLEVNGTPASRGFEPTVSDKEVKDSASINQSLADNIVSLVPWKPFSICAFLALVKLSLTTPVAIHQLYVLALGLKLSYARWPAEIDQETWLKDAVIGVFPDTGDCSPSLANFFRGEKRIHSSSRIKKETAQGSSSAGLRSSFVIPPDHRASEEPCLHTNFMRHLGPAVKQLTPANLPTQLTTDKNINNTVPPPVQLKRSLGTHQKKVWENWWATGNIGGRIALAAVVGCCFFTTCNLLNMQFGGMRSQSKWKSATESRMTSSTLSQSMDQRIGKLLGMIKNPLKHPPDARTMENSWPLDDLFSITKASAGSMNALRKRQMALEEAEALVKQWQAIKAEALGPNYQLQNLSEVLAESMLAQWKALAESAKARSCYWRFVLLKLSILRAEVLSNGIDVEMAEIEALLEEAAELVDESQPKNPNYYSSYKIRYLLKRQYDGSWRFCGSVIESVA